MSHVDGHCYRGQHGLPGWHPGGKTPFVFFPRTLTQEHQSALPESLRPRRNNRPDECVLDWPFLKEHGPL